MEIEAGDAFDGCAAEGGKEEGERKRRKGEDWVSIVTENLVV